MFSIPVDWMVYINGLLIIWILFDLYRGYKRGLILQVVDLVGTFVSLLTAWLLAPVFMNLFTFFKTSGNGVLLINQFMSKQINQLIWFVILFVVIRILLLVVTPLASFISKMPLIKQVNSAVGGVFSIVFFGVKLIIVLFLLTTPFVTNGNEVIENTWFKYVAKATEPVMKFADELVDRNSGIQSIINKQRLPEDQIKAMTDWFKDNGFTEGEIREFLKNYE